MRPNNGGILAEARRLLKYNTTAPENAAIEAFVTPTQNSTELYIYVTLKSSVSRGKPTFSVSRTELRVQAAV